MVKLGFLAIYLHIFSTRFLIKTEIDAHFFRLLESGSVMTRIVVSLLLEEPGIIPPPLLLPWDQPSEDWGRPKKHKHTLLVWFIFLPSSWLVKQLFCSSPTSKFRTFSISELLSRFSAGVTKDTLTRPQWTLTRLLLSNCNLICGISDNLYSWYPSGS